MTISRRRALGLAASASLFALLPKTPVFASSGEGLGLTADEALARLKKGNADFVAGRTPAAMTDARRRGQIAQKQTPFCAVLACADSRVPPELVFAQGLGDLFVIRVAGNTLDPESLGSIEYGVDHLGIPLVLVLGHERCGAVTAAIDVVEKGTELPGSLNAIVDPIVPAVLKAKRQPGNLIDNAVRQNVLDVVTRLGTSEAAITEPLAAGKLKLAGAVYDLDTGKVAFVA